jgi:E3 ubiquitin-protein ligase MYCBP2
VRDPSPNTQTGAKVTAVKAALNSLYDLPPPSSNADDYCTICYVEGLSAAPSVQLMCGHVLHLHCVLQKVNGSWSGARITFGFLNCPQCQALMQHPMLTRDTTFSTALKLKTSLEGKALQRLKFENLHKAPEIVKPGGQFFQSPLAYAMHRFAYYPCFKCNKPYFGGMRACGAPAAVGADGSFDKSELVCGACRPPAQGAGDCAQHGANFVQRKCRFCCSPAVWFCWGKTSFCDACHSKHNKVGLVSKPQSYFKQCSGPRACPLGMAHPPNGGQDEFNMGCGLCGASKVVGGAF